jgi:hypothetical protein
VSEALEARLIDLADVLDAPAGDGIARAVVSRLRSEEARSSIVGRGSSVRRRLLLAGAAIAAVAAGAVAAPAVADWFGVRGVEVRRDDRTGPTSSTTVVPRSGTDLDLGSNVASLAVAESTAGFAAVVPAALGAPDAVWVDVRGAAPFISLVYDDGPLVTEFDATLGEDAVLRKTTSAATTVEQLRIHGEPAVWIEGVHEVAVRARDGEYVFERLRLSDRVLLVQHGALTVRIETAAGMGRDDAVRIADSLPR